MTATVDQIDPPRITIALRSLIAGMPGGDFMLAQSRLMDYYSVRTSDVLKELHFELYQSLDWSLGKNPRALRVLSAESDGQTIPVGQPQFVVEETPTGRRLHVRVPVEVSVFDQAWLLRLTRAGASVTLEPQD